MINKETILKYLTQEDIMRRYFPYEVSLKKDYKNPFRHDRNPSCNFKYSKSGVFYFVDWAKGITYDCFQVAGVVLKEDNFQKILRTIDKDFSLNLVPNSLRVPNSKSNVIFKKIEQNEDFIKIDKRTYIIEYNDYFSDIELDFWKRYNIDKEDLDLFNVKSIKRFWFDKESFIESTKVSPIFQYNEDDINFQLYCPKRYTRFYSYIQSYQLLGYNYLPDKGDILIITSSMKDVIILRKIGLYAVCPSGESTPIKRKDIDELSSRFNKIYINYNNDEIGIESKNRLIENHKDVEFGVITNSKKDPSDVSKASGLDFLHKEIYSQL